jgi:hypothetical protein
MKLPSRRRNRSPLTGRPPRRHLPPGWSRARLFLEPLEDRLVLANVFWNVDADGFWDVASNWKDEFNAVRFPLAEEMCGRSKLTD